MCFDFFWRACLFSALIFFLIKKSSESNAERVYVEIEQERGSEKKITMGADRVTKFSRTLGRDKQLDEMLKRVDA